MGAACDDDGDCMPGGGQCCPTPEDDAVDVCVDESTDAINCGNCGLVCGVSQECVGGHCVALGGDAGCVPLGQLCDTTSTCCPTAGGLAIPCLAEEQGGPTACCSNVACDSQGNGCCAGLTCSAGNCIVPEEAGAEAGSEAGAEAGSEAGPEAGSDGGNCTAVGAACTTDTDCNCGLACSGEPPPGASNIPACKGSCQKCSPAGGTCQTTTDCCGTFWSQLPCSAQNACCGPLGTACIADGDCCGGVKCTQPEVVTAMGCGVAQKVCCLPNGASGCTSPTECCGPVNCSSGVCCNVAGETCNGSAAHCCSGACGPNGNCM